MEERGIARAWLTRRIYRSHFKGPTADDYVLPCAHYEMGALAWTEAINAGSDARLSSRVDLSDCGEEGTEESEGKGEKAEGTEEKAEEERGGLDARSGAVEEEEDRRVSLDAFRKEKVAECQASLDKAAAWESYVLDTRCGMRVKTGTETLEWYRKRMGWTS